MAGEGKEEREGMPENGNHASRHQADTGNHFSFALATNTMVSTCSVLLRSGLGLTPACWYLAPNSHLPRLDLRVRVLMVIKPNAFDCHSLPQYGAQTISWPQRSLFPLLSHLTLFPQFPLLGRNGKTENCKLLLLLMSPNSRSASLSTR